MPWSSTRPFRFGFGLILLIGLSACDEPEPIRIGFLGGLTGRNADLGVSALNGVTIAVNDVNQAGGINGRPVQVIARDDMQDPAVAQEQLADLAAASIEIVIGPMTSSIATALIPLANSRNILLLSPSAMSRELTGIDDNFLRIISDTSQHARRMARYLGEKTAIRRVVIVRDATNDHFTRSWSEDFTTEFKAQGGAIQAVIPFESKAQTHFQTLAAQAAASGGDAVLILAGNIDSALICQHLRNVDSKMPILVSEWNASDKFIAMGGASTEGVIVSQFMDYHNKTPSYKYFMEKYMAQFKSSPEFIASPGYQAAKIAMVAIAARGRGESLKEAILRIGTFPGLNGPIAIDRFGDSKRETFISVISGGQFHVVEP